MGLTVVEMMFSIFRGHIPDHAVRSVAAVAVPPAAVLGVFAAVAAGDYWLTALKSRRGTIGMQSFKTWLLKSIAMSSDAKVDPAPRESARRSYDEYAKSSVRRSKIAATAQ